MRIFGIQLINKNSKAINISSVIAPILLLNLFFSLFQFLYIFLRFKYINNVIPLWFTNLWGDYQLADKNNIYLIPIMSLSFFVIGFLFNYYFKKVFVRYGDAVVNYILLIANITLTVGLFRIIFNASVPFPPLIPSTLLNLIIPFLAAYMGARIVLPWFISYAIQNDMVTDPKVHSHPAMLLKTASARGGGTVYGLLFLLLGIWFTGFRPELSGFYLAVLMLSVLGYVDDYQNTHPESSFKVLENPTLRLFLIFSGALVLVFSGVYIKEIGNPFGGVIDLGGYALKIGKFSFPILAYVFTLIWLGWIVNLLSWSNGIDGQYGGIIGSASIFICILALRFTPILPIQNVVAILAAISAGLAFGFIKHTWYPSKIMWGFGAIVAGLVIAGLSILINTKILVSFLILMVPFLDAFVTFVRRILMRKSPLQGDRGHLHHILLDAGWSVQSIAKLYWFSTFFFGFVGLLSSERYLLQVVLTLGGIVAFVIVLLNYLSLRAKK